MQFKKTKKLTIFSGLIFINIAEIKSMPPAIRRTGNHIPRKVMSTLQRRATSNITFDCKPENNIVTTIKAHIQDGNIAEFEKISKQYLNTLSHSQLQSLEWAINKRFFEYQNIAKIDYSDNIWNLFKNISHKANEYAENALHQQEQSHGGESQTNGSLGLNYYKHQYIKSELTKRALQLTKDQSEFTTLSLIEEIGTENINQISEMMDSIEQNIEKNTEKIKNHIKKEIEKLSKMEQKVRDELDQFTVRWFTEKDKNITRSGYTATRERK